MSRFKALLIKDWNVNKKSLFVPLWIVAGFYLLTLLSVIIARLKGVLVFELMDYDYGSQSIAINYIVNSAMLILPGILCVLFTIVLSQNALNYDIRKNYEIFYRSQPVSIWKISGSKYLVSILGNWLVVLLIATFNFIVINIIDSFFFPFQFWYAISGSIHSMVIFFKISLVIGSIIFFASSIFRDSAFWKTTGIIIAISLFLTIINAIYGLDIPTPTHYLNKLLSYNPLREFNNLSTETEIIQTIKYHWGSLIFCWKTLYQILFSVVLFVGATLIYKNKEIR